MPDNGTRIKALENASWIWVGGESRAPSHTACFRTEFESATGGRAQVFCTADSRYSLWINDVYVGAGPARGPGGRPYVDTHTVTLRKGLNVVAFRVQYYTDHRMGLFAPVAGGLVCAIEQRGRTRCVSNPDWRAQTSTAYTNLPGFIYPECFDARAEDPRWRRIGFDASAWPRAREADVPPLAVPGSLQARPIPLIREKALQPRRIVRAGTRADADYTAELAEEDIATSLWHTQVKGRPATERDITTPCPGPYPDQAVTLAVRPGCSTYVCIDFGQGTLAVPELDLRGPEGTLIDIGYSEVLYLNHVATRWQCIRQSERIILRRGRTSHRLQQPRGFRYMIIRAVHPGQRAAKVVLERVTAHESIYPTRQPGRFRCSDPILDRIFDVSARTLNLCMEDAFTDCPWRERSQWVGDAQPEALFNYYTFAAYDLCRKAVTEFTSGNTEAGWIPGIFPVTRQANLPTWGMRVPVIVWEYYLHTGDDSVLTKAWDAVRRQMDWLASHENKDGLLVDLPGWNFVDWTSLDATAAGGAVQGWYLEAIDATARLADAVGRAGDARRWRRRAARLRRAIADAYWDPDQKAFRKYSALDRQRPVACPESILGQHENFLFCLLGVGSRAQRRAALAAMAGATRRYLPDLGGTQSRFLALPPDLHPVPQFDPLEPAESGNYASEAVCLIGSPFWSFYALLALAQAGQTQDVLEYMRICWGMMLDHGATTWWEMWDRNASCCHGWSSAPAMVLPGFILGVKPTAPGFRQFEVCPRLGDLEWAEGRIPTPHGIIEVSAQQDGRRWICRISLPEGTRADFCWNGQAGSRQRLRPGVHELTGECPG